MRKLVRDPWTMAMVAVLVAAFLAGRVQSQAVESRQIEGEGAWVTSGVEADRAGRPTRLSSSRTGAKRWQGRVVRGSDNTVRGEINLTVGDAVVVANGKVKGQTDGSRVWGDVVDETGKPVLTFEGAVTGNGIQGRFTSADDELGTWSWEGPLPQ